MTRARSAERTSTTLPPTGAKPALDAARPLRALIATTLVLLFIHSCQSPDPVAKEKARTLTADEGYLVAYYMKIIEFEKYLHDNPGSLEEKREELEKSLDRERIRRTLAELEKRPERWLAIYNRINELQLHALQGQSTGRD